MSARQDFRRPFRCAPWLGLVVTLLTATPAAALAVEGDVVFKRGESAEQGTPPAVFSHWSHRIRYRCHVCHPAIFEMKANSTPITMDAIMDEKSCGVCHNGKTTWSVTFETCQRCHRSP